LEALQLRFNLLYKVRKWYLRILKISDNVVLTSQETIVQYQCVVAELERVAPPCQLLQLGNQREERGVLQALPPTLNNVHDYLLHVAARLERLTQRIDQAKAAHLARLKAVCFYSSKPPTQFCCMPCLLGWRT
jgi:hypothetical protein